MKKYLGAIKRQFKLVRGLGFAGDGRQRQLTAQIQIMERLGVNKFFIKNFPELLFCNQSHTGVADKLDVSKFLEAYFESQKRWLNYPAEVGQLSGWVDSKGHVWPNLHPAHKHVVDVYKKYLPKTVCEIGAGAGVVAKYVFAASESRVGLTCVEGSDKHLAEMRQNFDNSDIIPPKIKVAAEVVKGVAQKLPFAENHFELVYTCTVMMHNPYIAAVLAASEMARVSSKYILHVEGFHTDGITGFRDKYNLLLLDYQRLYHKLGFKTVEKFYYQDPYSTEYDYIVFLAEKIS